MKRLLIFAAVIDACGSLTFMKLQKQKTATSEFDFAGVSDPQGIHE